MDLNLPPPPEENQLQQLILIPPQIPPPHGFSFVEHPEKVVNQIIPLYGQPELNPNIFEFFTQCACHGRVFVHAHCLRQLCRDRAKWPEKIKVLFMKPKNLNGPTTLAHLPSHLDLFGFSDVAKLVLNHELNNLDKCNHSMVTEDDDGPMFPDAWIKFIDPKPEPRDYGRIFLLRNVVSIRNTSFSDGVDIFHVLAPMTHLNIRFYHGTIQIPKKKTFMNFLRVTPGIAENSLFIPIHTSILIWNCRGIGRPSFPSNFHKLVRVHNPSIVVLTETRCVHKDAFALIFREQLQVNFNWYLFPSKGLKGGSTILWKNDVVEVGHKVQRILDYPVLDSLFQVPTYNQPLIHDEHPPT